MLNTPRSSDEVILQKIRNNNLQGWEELYDAYSASMLGIICKLVDDKNRGQQILVNIFTGAAFAEFLDKITSSLPGKLYQYTFNHTLALLNAEGTQIDVGMIEGLPGIFKVLYQNDNNAGNLNRVPAIPRSYKWLPMYGVNIYADMISYS